MQLRILHIKSRSASRRHSVNRQSITAAFLTVWISLALCDPVPDAFALPPAELKQSEHAPPAAQGMSLTAAEAAHIQRVLKETNGVIGGPSGAAARLGMKRTTLHAKIKKLGISRPA